MVRFSAEEREGFLLKFVQTRFVSLHQNLSPLSEVAKA